MTNEELWLAARIAEILQIPWLDIVPRRGPGDDVLLSQDRNPNTNGARLLGLTDEPGARLPAMIDAINAGQIQALFTLGENPIRLGISDEVLGNLPAYIVMDILSNEATHHATALLPASAYAEKRGSMINGKGRLQRLNRAVRPPGQARDDWEILRDLLQALTGSNGVFSLDEVFRQMSEAVPQLSGLTLAGIGDLGVQVLGTDGFLAPSRPSTAHDIEQAVAEDAAAGRA
jgi:NADH-quinone oxidoreductase subunit G